MGRPIQFRRRFVRWQDDLHGLHVLPFFTRNTHCKWVHVQLSSIQPENGISNNRKDADFPSIAGHETPHLTEELSASTAASPTDLLCALCVLCGFLQLLFPIQ
ncbi:MAG: hypothetical protein RIS76_1338 [Verrucomicrobiota bacterium]|jgi:hypothetical protein